MTNAGVGYSSAPQIVFESSYYLSKLDIRWIPGNVLDPEFERLLRVVPARKYQLQSANILDNWIPVGAAFIAPSEQMTQVYDPESGMRFFRLCETP